MTSLVKEKKIQTKKWIYGRTPKKPENTGANRYLAVIIIITINNITSSFFNQQVFL